MPCLAKIAVLILCTGCNTSKPHHILLKERMGVKQYKEIKKSPVFLRDSSVVIKFNYDYAFFFSLGISDAAPKGLSLANSTSIGAPTKIEE